MSFSNSSSLTRYTSSTANITTNSGMFSRTARQSPILEVKSQQNEIQEMLEGINIDLLSQLVNTTKTKAELAKDQNLFLLVGRTGAGKSTTLNHLMGSQLEVDDSGMQPRLILSKDEKCYATIGHESVSQTLHPEVVPVKRSFLSSYAYCDCPGFNDNHLQEEKICASIGVPMVVSYAKSVQGLIVVIDCADLTATKGEGLSSLFNTLGGLLKNPASMLTNDRSSIAKNVITLFTKVPSNKDMRHITQTLTEKNTTLEKQIKTLTDDTKRVEISLAAITGKVTEIGEAKTQEDRSAILMDILNSVTALKGDAANRAKELLEKLARNNKDMTTLFLQQYFLKSILDNIKNCFILRGTGSEDRDLILNKINEINQLEAISKDQFAVHGKQNNLWAVLDKVLEKIAAQGSQLYIERDRHSSEATQLKKYISIAKDKQREEKDLSQQLTNTPALSESELRNTHAAIFNFNSLSEFYQEEMLSEQSSRAKIEAELEKIDTSEPTRYLHRSLEPKDFESRFGTLITTSIAMSIPFIALGIPAIYILNLLSMITSTDSSSYDNSIFTRAARWYIHDSLNFFGDLLLERHHQFQYNDIPFIRAEHKAEPSRNDFTHASPRHDRNGFNISTRIAKPEEGKYEITYTNSINAQESSAKSWIELYVEKRLHPDYRSRINILKNQASLAESRLISFLRLDLEQLNKARVADMETLTGLTGNDLQIALSQIIDKRLNLNSSRLARLNDCVNEIETDHKNVCVAIEKAKSRFDLVKQLLSVIDSKNIFIKEFIAQHDNEQSINPVSNGSFVSIEDRDAAMIELTPKRKF